MTTETKPIDKNKFLFQTISESVKRYGAEGLYFMLLNNKTESHFYQNESSFTLGNLFLIINTAVEKQGIDNVIFLIQNKKTYLPEYAEKLKYTQELHDKIFNIVCKNFDTTRESMLGKARNGKRFFASGIAVKILIEIFNYSLDEIQQIIPKSIPQLSKYKTSISNLDFNHPYEKQIFRKHLFCKQEIINYILKQEQNG